MPTKPRRMKGKKFASALGSIFGSRKKIQAIPEYVEKVKKGELSAVFARIGKGARVAVSLFRKKPITVNEFVKMVGKENWRYMLQHSKFLEDLKRNGLNLENLRIGCDVQNYITTKKEFEGKDYASSVLLRGEQIMARNGAQIRVIAFTGKEVIERNFYQKNGYSPFPFIATDRPGREYEEPRFILYKILKPQTKK